MAVEIYDMTHGDRDEDMVLIATLDENDVEGLKKYDNADKYSWRFVEAGDKP